MTILLRNIGAVPMNYTAPLIYNALSTGGTIVPRDVLTDYAILHGQFEVNMSNFGYMVFKYIFSLLLRKEIGRTIKSWR